MLKLMKKEKEKEHTVMAKPKECLLQEACLAYFNECRKVYPYPNYLSINAYLPALRQRQSDVFAAYYRYLETWRVVSEGPVIKTKRKGGFEKIKNPLQFSTSHETSNAEKAKNVDQKKSPAVRPKQQPKPKISQREQKYADRRRNDPEKADQSKLDKWLPESETAQSLDECSPPQESTSSSKKQKGRDSSKTRPAVNPDTDNAEKITTPKGKSGTVKNPNHFICIKITNPETRAGLDEQIDRCKL